MEMPIHPWDPYGAALLAWHNGKHDTTLLQTYRDGDSTELPVEIFFRKYDEMPDLEQYALSQCMGKVLDIGAGTGEHALVLQEMGLDVVGLDVAEGAVRIMKENGLEQVWQKEVYDLKEVEFDTLLMIMNGIGFVGDLDGLRHFLDFAKTIISPYGQILLDSSDLRNQDLESIYGADYFGETEVRLAFDGMVGDWIKWLYVDYAKLEAIATECGWQSEEIYEGVEGRYLARLSLG